MSATLATTATVSSQPMFVPADATNLSIIADHLKNNNLHGALYLCETIQGIYNKNMAYLLVSLWHLGHLHIGLARNCLTHVHPASDFDRNRVARTSIEVMIALVESHFSIRSYPLLSKDIVIEEFHFHPVLLREAVAQCVKNINDIQRVHSEAHEAQQQEAETSYQFSIESSDNSSSSWIGPYLAFASADSDTSTDSDTSNGVVWIETN